jgi:PAS domain S-box-containing protein
MNRLYRYVPLLGLFLGFGIALLAGVRTQLNNEARAAATFDTLALRAASQIRQRMGNYEYGLRGARGAIIGAGDEKINRQIFSRYMSSRELDREFPGARGFGFVRRVPASGVDRFISEARQDGWPDFLIMQLGPNNGERFVIQYVEPAARNLQAIGLDIASEPNRRDAALRSMQTASIAITSPIDLVQTGGQRHNGFLMLLPIYRNGMPTQTEAQREAATFGWSYAAVAMDEVMNGFDYREGRITLQIHDYSAPRGGRAFFTSPGFDEDANHPHLQKSVTLDIGGREWTVDVQATPHFIASLNLDSPWVIGGTIAGLGVILSILIASMQLSNKRSLALVQAEAMHRSNERYRALVDGVHDYAIIQLDPQGQIVAWNKGAERIKGYATEDIIGKHFSVFYPSDTGDADYFEAKLAYAREHGSERDEGWRLRKDGSRFWAHVTITPLYDEAGQLIGYSKITRDLTERRERETALRDINALQQAILDNAGVAIISCTRGGIIKLFNPSAERLLGYSAAELVNRYSPSIFHDQGEVFARAEALSQELGVRIEPGFETFVAKAKNGEVDAREWTYVAKNGRRIPVQLTITGLFDEERNLLGFVGLAIDLTEQKRHEAEIEAARELAEQAARTKSEFLANMSHEIRTPMNAILGMTQLVLQGELQPQQRDYLSKAFSASKALLAILNDILDYSKIEAGRMELEEREMSLETTLSNTLALFSAQAEQKGLELVFDAPADLPGPLLGDPLRISQVLSNLLGNAIKFTEKGSVTLKVECIAQDERACRIRFSVGDTGIGMSEDQIERLFAPFSQADSSITRRFGGTGLGLSISKTLVELMRGELTVSSRLDEGSVFSFTLDFAPSGGLPIRQQSLQRIGIRSALVVDDQETAALVLKLQLNSWGVPARIANSGEAALVLLEAAERQGAPFDLLLLDWKMPEMDGLAVVSMIEGRVRDGRLSNMPVIMMVSAYSREELLRRISGLQITAVLSKPVMPSNLFNTLMELEQAPGIVAPTAQEKPDPLVHYQTAAGSLQGVRILLAEDNTLNQQVALAFLEGAGVQVIIANDGEEALDLAGREQFDAILMDLQMPKMDGLEATRLIRALPGGAELPILAMTAAVMERDRKACIDAGMDDFLAKPIDPEKLIQTLCLWVRPHAEAPAATPQREPAQALLPAAIVNHPDIDTAAALHRMAGNQALYTRLLQAFAIGCADIADTLAGNERSVVAHSVHQLKGETGNLGLRNLAALCADIEPELHDAEAPWPTAKLAQLRSEVEALAAHLRTALATVPTAIHTVPRLRQLDEKQRAALSAKLEQLQPLLASQRMQALSVAEQLGVLLSNTELEPLYTDIHERIRQLQFRAAHESLDALIAAARKST